MLKKLLFLDRDGTLIEEPEDKQVDSINKFKLKPNVIIALHQLQVAGYQFIMITNQDGLGTNSFEQHLFDAPQNLLMNLLESQGIYFKDILICPHFATELCECRKPRVGLVKPYLRDKQIDFNKSWVIGDRKTDLQLAENMGISGLLYDGTRDWLEIARDLITNPRRAFINRKTNETDIQVAVNLDQCNHIQINTGIAFFDHMLEQLAKHGGFNLTLVAKGDLHIDEHHTVEDCALALGQAVREALGDKMGINRYGFLLPMDDALAQIAIDLCGRHYFIFEGEFQREKVGDLPTELVPHFFRSFAESLQAVIQIKITGTNVHHMIESIFKGVGRTLRQAVNQNDFGLPTTKGIL